MTTAESVESGPRARSEWECFVDGANRQWALISKLILHYMRTRYQKSRIGYASALIEPCIHMLILSFLMIVVRQRMERMGLSPIVIVASGLLPFLLFRANVQYLAGSISSSKILLKHPLLKHIDVIIARFILESLTMIAAGTLIFSVLIFLGVAPWPYRPLNMFLPLGGFLMMGLGVGTFAAFVLPVYPSVKRPLGIMMRLLYLTSGIFFLGRALPAWMLQWALYNPAFHAMEAFREGYLPIRNVSFIQLWYPYAFGLTFFMIGIAFERVMHYRLKESDESVSVDDSLLE